MHVTLRPPSEVVSWSLATLSYYLSDALHFLIFDPINLDSALLRDVDSLGDPDWHVLSDPWWLQSIVRSQEDSVDVLQCPAFRLWAEEIEDNNRQRVGAHVNLR